MRNKKGGDLKGSGGGEELEEIEGDKTIIRIYYMRKDYILNKRERNNLLQ